MRMRMAVAIIVGCTASVAAQQSSADKMTPNKDQASAATTITVAGCVQAESAVLKKNVVTREVGMADEFVITNARLRKGTATEPEPAATTGDPKPPDTVGTSGSPASFGKVYRVTGDKENELKPQIGQRVEITGTFKHEEDAKAELGAAVGTSGRAPAAELTEANTPEITIVSIKAIAGTCSPGPGK